MKACELMRDIIGDVPPEKKTCDTCKHGDPDREVRKVGVCFMASADVLKAAEAWGADLLITHECSLYDHWDIPRNDPISLAKAKLIDSCSFTLWRFHDHIHWRKDWPDGIHDGFLKMLGLDGTFDGASHVRLPAPLTVREIAKLIQERTGAVNARIAGDPGLAVTGIFLGLGAAGLDDFPADAAAELAIVGESCEWRNVEQFRDAPSLGFKKALIVLGHGTSEAPGMRILAKWLEPRYPGIEFRYLDCGDIYSYV